MKVIEVFSVSGGTGATTTACAIAMSASALGHKTLIVDDQKNKNVTAIFGIQDLFADDAIVAVGYEDGLYVTNNICASLKDIQDFDVVVVDTNVNIQYSFDDADVVRVGVVRNDYLSLKNHMKSDSETDAIVCTYTKDNALNTNDVNAVLMPELGLIKVERDLAIQRACDAGLFCSRLSKFEQYNELREFVSETVPKLAKAE
jgi:hypothetical protein